MAKQRLLNWSKCASVTTGGKPHFFTAKCGNHQYWVVWDRRYSAWVVEDSFGSVWGNYGSSNAAIVSLEHLIKSSQ